MVLAEEEKLAAIQNLLTKIREMKLIIEEKIQQKTAKESKLNAFSTSYEMYVTELRNQRRGLELQIRRIRNQIQILQDPEEEESRPEETVVSNPSEQPSSEKYTQDQKTIDDNQVKKENIRRHFARFWHPDVTTKDVEPGLMIQLNMIFSQAKDEIDMLAYIPWNEAWEKQGKSESLGAQWERLMDWHADLQVASQRLDVQLVDIDRNSYYPLLAEWESYENKDDYFARLAKDERKQIRHIEETVKALQQQLSEISKGEYY